jgi:hypothetical protein
MTILDLHLIAFLFLLVGGWTQAAERCRDLLDFFRPPQQPAAPPFVRPFHVPPPPGVAEQTVNGAAAMPPPPEPEFAPELYPNLYEQDEQGRWRARTFNPDFAVKETDKDLAGKGGIMSHIPEPEDEE